MIEIPQYINPKLKLAYIGRGRRLECYQTSTNLVLKVQRRQMTKEQACSFLDSLKADYCLLVSYLENSVCPTEYVIGNQNTDNGTVSVLSVQPFIKGITIKSALDSNICRENINIFLGKCLRMYRETGLIPDLFGKQHVYGWYYFERSSNVKITENGVVLVDTSLARITKIPLVGHVANNMLKSGIHRTIKS